MYRTCYAPLVRQAALLVGDAATAEDVVQDSFAAMHGAWWRLRDTDKAVHYLRRSVINRSRSVLRHRAVAGRPLPELPPDVPSAEDDALVRWERSLVGSALAMLSPRQREAVVLRYYADLSESQVAAAMGISTGAVKAHTARAMGSLRAVLAAAVAPALFDVTQRAR
jgi:RNA polymerase sigma-70 factor (sigma-E family)